jgi:rhamnosyltransferase
VDKMLVSAVIPVKNGVATIKACLEALLGQSVSANMEIIILDSGSTDGTLDIVRQFPVTVIDINPAAFNHGLTRNEGFKQANGEFVYFTVQDAVLADSTALERMLSHFTDANVAGVCGNQGTPHDKDKNPITWYRPVDAPTITKIHFPVLAEFNRLSPEEMCQACAWDDVNAMYRHSMLEKIPFVRTDFAEDYFWTKQALQAGFTIIRDSGVVTWHYHHQYFKYAFRLHFIIHFHFYKFFNLIPGYPPVFSTITVTAWRLLKEKSLGPVRKGYWFFHNVSWLAGKWYAAFIFRRLLKKKDEEKLSAAYGFYCGKIPQGRLKQAAPKRINFSLI